MSRRWFNLIESTKGRLEFLAYKIVGSTREEWWIGGIEDPRLLYAVDYSFVDTGSRFSFHQRGNSGNAIVIVTTEPINDDDDPNLNFQFDMSGAVTAQFAPGVLPPNLMVVDRGWGMGYQRDVPTENEGNRIHTAYLNFSEVRQDSLNSLGYAIPLGLPGRLYTLPSYPTPEADYRTNETAFGRGLPSVAYDHALITNSATGTFNLQAYYSAATGELPLVGDTIQTIRTSVARGVAHNAYYNHPFVYVVDGFVSNSNPNPQNITLNTYRLEVGQANVTGSLESTEVLQPKGFDDPDLIVFGVLIRV
ncbi:hypothetical protein N836_31390 [Leptolyngbya sp. Heron Island J]|uniref:hypothetical protein n=1 Tax=Leptolyngbya sp. Heron Island J TaxID=1385935 RepID=UPI0003B98FF2|nr:hypothetical protein [Leptolyngbya sp. Heron Island J]ESA38446.1 hypothetical protein N836_31390 [Leptolyngbya sp. Heron Island J]